MAVNINRRMGTNYGPWDIDNIDSQWLKVFIVLDNEEDIIKNKTQATAYILQAQKNHPTFRKSAGRR